MSIFSRKASVEELWRSDDFEAFNESIRTMLEQGKAREVATLLPKLWDIRADIYLLLTWPMVINALETDEAAWKAFRDQISLAEKAASSAEEHALVLHAKVDLYAWNYAAEGENLERLREVLNAMVLFQQEKAAVAEDWALSMLDMAICMSAVRLQELDHFADALDRQYDRGETHMLSIWKELVADALSLAKGALPCEWLLADWYKVLSEVEKRGGSPLREFKLQAFGNVEKNIGFSGFDTQSVLDVIFKMEDEPKASTRRLWLQFKEAGSLDCLAYYLIAVQQAKELAGESEDKPPAVDLSDEQFKYLHGIVTAKDFLSRPLRVRGVLLMAWLTAAASDSERLTNQGMTVSKAAEHAMSHGAREYVRARQALGSLYISVGEYQAAIDIYDAPFDPKVLNARDQYFCSNWEPETSTRHLEKMSGLLRTLLTGL